MPTPMPLLAGAMAKPLMAIVTASHRVGCLMPNGGRSHSSSFVGHCIEPDLSSMMKMSDGSAALSLDCTAQAASGVRPPVPPAPVPVVPGTMIPVAQDGVVAPLQKESNGHARRCQATSPRTQPWNILYTV